MWLTCLSHKVKSDVLHLLNIHYIYKFSSKNISVDSEGDWFYTVVSSSFPQAEFTSQRTKFFNNFFNDSFMYVLFLLLPWRD